MQFWHGNYKTRKNRSVGFLEILKNNNIIRNLHTVELMPKKLSQMILFTGFG